MELRIWYCDTRWTHSYLLFITEPYLDRHHLMLFNGHESVSPFYILWYKSIFLSLFSSFIHCRGRMITSFRCYIFKYKVLYCKTTNREDISGFFLIISNGKHLSTTYLRFSILNGYHAILFTFQLSVKFDPF